MSDTPLSTSPDDAVTARGFPVGRIIVGFLAGLALAGTLLVFVDWSAVLETLSSADPLFVTLSGVVALGALVAWSESLRLFFRASGASLSVWTCLRSYIVATFARMAMPVGQSLGPALFVYAVHRRTDRSYSADLAPTSVGEVSNHLVSAVVAVVGGLLVFGVAAPDRQVRVLQVGLSVVLVGTAGGGTLLWFRRDSLRSWVLAGAAVCRATVGRISERVHRALDPARVDTSVTHYYETVKRLSARPDLVVRALAFSALAWVATASALVFSGVAIDAHISLALALFVVPPIGLLGFLPLPGALGGVELALTGLLVHLGGLAPESAVAAVVLYRLSTYWLPLAASGGTVTWLWTVGWHRE